MIGKEHVTRNSIMTDSGCHSNLDYGFASNLDHWWPTSMIDTRISAAHRQMLHQTLLSRVKTSRRQWRWAIGSVCRISIWQSSVSNLFNRSGIFSRWRLSSFYLLHFGRTLDKTISFVIKEVWIASSCSWIFTCGSIFNSFFPTRGDGDLSHNSQSDINHPAQ